MTIKEALGTAVTTFGDLFPDEADDVRVEEIDRANDAWKITISIANPDFEKELGAQRKLRDSTFGLSSVSAIPPDSRKYKSILLNLDNGELLSIKNA